MRFKKKDIVMHILSKDYLLVMDSYGEEMYTCKTKTYELVNFHEWELVEPRK